jgi:hypothetical protein
VKETAVKIASVATAAIALLAPLIRAPVLKAQDAFHSAHEVILTPLDAATVDDALRSSNATTRASINFVNRSSSAVDIYWISYEGDRMLYHAGLAVGAAWKVDTFLTHPWLVVVSGTGGTTTQDTGFRLEGFEALTPNGDTAIITSPDTADAKGASRLPAPAARQDTERVYNVGERVGDTVVERPTIVHQPVGELSQACRSNSRLRRIGVEGKRVIGADGNVHDTSITNVTVWVSDGGGETLIDESDPRWKDFTSAIETFKKQTVERFSQERYRPGTLDRAPVAVWSTLGVSVSCPATRN